MKNLNYILFLLVFGFCISCNSNRLKTDEKSLAKQILTEEEQLAHEAELRAEREKQLADSIAKLPKGFRFQEDRSIDLNNPPVIIDIIGSRKNQQKIKLSQLFDHVEYIQLESDPDSIFIASGFENIIVSKKHIYGFSFQAGVAQFSLDGKFIGFVCKNNLPVSQTPEGAARMLMTSGPATKMAWQIFFADGNLCYKYLDRENQTTSYYQFDDEKDCSETLVLPIQEVEKTENKPQGTRFAQFSDKFVSKSTTLYPLPGGMKALAQNGKPVSESIPFISVLSTKGDTICSFRDCDPIRNLTKSVYRGVDDGNTYYSNGSLFVRQAYNDTIYQLVPPNRLIPRYILSFGNLGIQSAIEGIDPGVSLKEKLILQDFLETNRYIFITYTKDYSCPNTAKSGTLKFSRLIFDKKSGTITSIYIDEAPFIAKEKMAWPKAPDLNIENDLDKIPFRWPESTTANGLPVAVYSGDELLKINDPAFPVKNIRKNDKILAIYH